ncbi:MAG: (2Fe-2S)-binding protein [Casimicrobium sp.]
MNLTVNGQVRAIAAPWVEESLLSVLSEHLGLVGTKYGCGVGLCGACTVLVDGKAARSCMLRVRSLGNVEITTIEGLSRNETLHPVQHAWLEESVSQCGYCQAGQIMSTVALLKSNPNPSDVDIDAALDGNLCRCGTQQRIRRAVHAAAKLSRSSA